MPVRIRPGERHEASTASVPPTMTADAADHHKEHEMTEPESIDHYQEVARVLREIAGHFSDLATQNLPRPAITISVQYTAALDGLPDGDQQKIAVIDATGQALLGKSGTVQRMSGGSYHYNASGFVGPVWVGIFDSITAPEQRAKDDEIARLRAELAELKREPGDGHVYTCCGKVGRISPHESWCTGGDPS